MFFLKKILRQQYIVLTWANNVVNLYDSWYGVWIVIKLWNPHQNKLKSLIIMNQISRVESKKKKLKLKKDKNKMTRLNLYQWSTQYHGPW